MFAITLLGYQCLVVVCAAQEQIINPDIYVPVGRRCSLIWARIMLIHVLRDVRLWETLVPVATRSPVSLNVLLPPQESGCTDRASHIY